MDVKTQGVHYQISEATQEFIDKKLQRLTHLEDLIVDLQITISRSSKGSYTLNSDIHFRWGNTSHIHIDNIRELYKGIELLFDKIEAKSQKEKEKIQHH